MYRWRGRYYFPASIPELVTQSLVGDSVRPLLPAVMLLLSTSGKMLGYRRAGRMDNKVVRNSRQISFLQKAGIFSLITSAV